MEEFLKKHEALEESEAEEDDGDHDWEDVVEEEMDQFDESKGIDVNTCLFCDYKSDFLCGQMRAYG